MVVEGDATDGAGLHSVEVVEMQGDKVLDLPHCAFLLYTVLFCTESS